MKKLILILLFVNIFAVTFDIDKISSQAQKQNKKLLIFFHMDYCGYCEKMLKNNFKNNDILNKITKDYIYIDVNISDDDIIVYKNFKGTQSEFARKYKIYFFPTTIFLQDDKVIYKVKGYRNSEKFAYILKYIKSDEYKHKQLEEFILDQEMM